MDQQTGRLDALLIDARTAMGRGDFSAALQSWNAIADDFEVRVGIATAVRGLQRWDEADSLFGALRAAYPDKETVVCGWAWVAHGRGAWPEAARRWAEVRARWPTNSAGYHGGGVALRILQQYEAAAEVYEQAFAHGLSFPELWDDFAMLASAAGDAVEGQRRWAVCRERWPQHLRAYTAAAEDLAAQGRFDDAQAMYKDAVERFPQNKTLTLQYARTVRRHGTLEAALKAWEAVIAADHSQVEGYLGAAECLAGLGRYDDAQTVLQPAVRLFGDNRAVVEQQARLAHRARDWDTALAGWKAIRDKFPDDPSGWFNGVSTLRVANRIKDAEALVAEGIDRFAESYELRFEWALLPQIIQNYSEHTRRFAEVSKLFPTQRSARVHHTDALARQRLWDESEAILQQAEAELGPGPDLAYAGARNAEIVRKFDVALARWTRLRDADPTSIETHLGAIRCLREKGKFAKCKKAINAAAALFPDMAEVSIQRALLANRLREWTVALPIWADLKARYPFRGDVASGVTDALWQARQDQAISGEGAPAFEIPEILLQAAPSADEEAERLRRIFMRYESIGNSCEFGMAQRRFHADPIGLLRWAGIEPEKAIMAVRNGFASMTDPAVTTIRDLNGEYIVENSEYGIFSHTFTPSNSEPLDRFTRSQRARLKFLTQKLVDDFAFAEKIFVYAHKNVTLDQARALHAAIREYGGRACLLCVRLADADHVPGQVDLLDDGLYVGYTDRFSTVDINVDNWREICTRVSDLWDGASGDTAKAAE
jgi:tetratricopeptide (TPR) repeat protein